MRHWGTGPRCNSMGARLPPPNTHSGITAPGGRAFVWCIEEKSSKYCRSHWFALPDRGIGARFPSSQLVQNEQFDSTSFIAHFTSAGRAEICSRSVSMLNHRIFLCLGHWVFFVMPESWSKL
ncbi:hypothetical protein NPIL_437691 [Nephila pilipes]|uniref:Uncharacterized protein n=1 Tax=Nephila pilipes TaxID=299642 RepID=A0A8X6P0B9_NEPPI|nr:hypothetical protein NPIL_437691 [Nephila pilipes]